MFYLSLELDSEGIIYAVATRGIIKRGKEHSRNLNYVNEIFADNLLYCYIVLSSI